jgi:hypothetical protein
MAKIVFIEVEEIGMRNLMAVFLMGSILVMSGCGEPPKVLPQGSSEQQAEDARNVLQQVVSQLAAGETRAIIEQKRVFLPLRWRKQQKEFEELEALSRQLQGRQSIVLGEAWVEGRWAMIDGVIGDGERIGIPGAPWVMLYFDGQWRWLPISILKDQVVVGMMDSHFDRLWARWQATHPATSR